MVSCSGIVSSIFDAVKLSHLPHQMLQLARDTQSEIVLEARHVPRRMTMPAFRDRQQAGRQLATDLATYANRGDIIVLALPRGGVPVGFEVAKALNAPLEVFLVRKLGVPFHEELAMGAIASGGVQVLDEDLIHSLRISDQEVQRVIVAEQAELARREKLYRSDRPFPQLSGKTAILVDDGLATGATMRAAVAALRAEGPAKVVVAVPVASPEICEAFRQIADDCVCALTPSPFHAVGLWYEDFSQTSDEEVHDMLERSRAEIPAAPAHRV